jgi:putative NADPH-quinone reductase
MQCPEERMARIAIIDGHPDPDRARFVHALADAYAQGAEAGIHEVRRIDVAAVDFPVLRSATEWRETEPAAAIHRAQIDIRWADHLVILYPLWLGDMPALLKAFLEQVMRPGFAIDETVSADGTKLLGGRSARIIVTMGMPASFYRFFYRAHRLKILARNILGFAGIAPLRHSIIGSVEKDDGHREHWLGRIAGLGRDAR